jgi:hypothetical protein
MIRGYSNRILGLDIGSQTFAFKSRRPARAHPAAAPIPGEKSQTVNTSGFRQKP